MVEYLVEMENSDIGRKLKIKKLSEDVLELSARSGYLDVIKYGVELGEDIHFKDDILLSLAANGGHIDIVKYLVELGADIHAVKK